MDAKLDQPKLDQHYVDPRLVALYDTNNPSGPDTDFYLRLADGLGAQRILDLGCGTGLLTRQLATQERDVTGIDPAPAMLAWAKAQPGAGRVEWREGDSRVLGTLEADLALMTGNVAQVFLEDEQWADTLRDLHAALRGGGVLAFESRNPAARDWEQWNREATNEQISTPDSPLECWLDVVRVEGGRVRFLAHNVFGATGEDIVVESELRFRSRDELVESLTEAGFAAPQVYGDWQNGPMNPESRIMVFVAHRL
ncbi:class I SAM-dependent methyltransferase [Deinococcus sp.]|uniref:class I SAM-dependent methyltransferase n=1 Tax=Deinococcus sp. TaxID=47478 RepID=UPI003B5C7D05